MTAPEELMVMAIWNTWRYRVWLMSAACLVALPSVAHAADHEHKLPMVDYVLVITGDELLAGAYPDAHTAFITRTLRPLGFRCLKATIVGDAFDPIQQAVREARKLASLVIVTGGLGPTPDDVTRDAISALTGVALREHPALITDLERRFGVTRDELRPNLRRQTEVPVRGAYLLNPHGTAAGLIFEDDDGLIVAVPGPPREMQPMIRDLLIPRLRERFGERFPGHLLMVRFVGIGESAIAHTISERISIPEDVTVASLFEGMRVDFFFTMPGDSPRDRVRLDQLEADVLHHLGEYVYATNGETLEEHVVNLLAQRGETLAVAEAGSGGSLTAALGSSAAISGVLVGSYVAPDTQRLEKLIGGEAIADRHDSASTTAAILAERLASRGNASLALALVASPAQEGDGRFVETAFWHQGQATTQRVASRGGGELSRVQLTTQLLDLIRRRLTSPGARTDDPG